MESDNVSSLEVDWSYLSGPFYEINGGKDLHFKRVILTFIIFLFYFFSWLLDNFRISKDPQFWLENFQVVFKLFSSQRTCFPGGETYFGVLTSAASFMFTQLEGSQPVQVRCLMEFHSQKKQIGAKSNLYQGHDQYRWKRTRCIWKRNYNTARSQPVTSQVFLPSPPQETVCITVKWLFFYLSLQPHVLKPLTCSACNHFNHLFSRRI